MLAIEPEIVETYVTAGEVQLVFRPILNHGEYSLVTSAAAVCAARQGQFWPMHDLLFARLDEVWSTAQGDLPALMVRYAGEIGLDTATFEACQAAGEARAQVQAWDAEQRAQGIRLQPTFEINGQRLVGLQSFETFQSIIDELLAAESGS